MIVQICLKKSFLAELGMRQEKEDVYVSGVSGFQIIDMRKNEQNKDIACNKTKKQISPDFGSIGLSK